MPGTRISKRSKAVRYILKAATNCCEWDGDYRNVWFKSENLPSVLRHRRARLYYNGHGEYYIAVGCRWFYDFISIPYSAFQEQN